VREKERKEAAALAAAADGAPQLPKDSPALENPVEGVRGLIEGGFFVGDSAERAGAHPAILQSAATAAALEHATHVATALSIVAIPEAEDEDDALEFHHGEDIVMDDSTESASTSDPDQVPRLVRTGSLSEDDDSSADDHSLPPSSSGASSDGRSSLSPELDGGEQRGGSGNCSSDGEEGSEQKEKRRAECRAKFGLAGLGKWTRSDVYQDYSSFSGF
jgi:hypothetical protein